MVEQWVKDMTEKYIPKTENINGIEYERITSPKSGEVVYFEPFHNTEDYSIGDFYKIKIKDGQYWGTYGLSNFWYWYRLDENGNIIKEEHGYGKFFKCP
jgi:hypothetical protein